MSKGIESAKTPRQIFESEIDEKTKAPKFSQYNADGVPTHDGQGQELSKSAAKNAAKDFQKQKKLNEEWAKKIEATPDLLQQMEAEVQRLMAEVQQLEAQLQPR